MISNNLENSEILHLNSPFNVAVYSNKKLATLLEPDLVTVMLESDEAPYPVGTHSTTGLNHLDKSTRECKCCTFLLLSGSDHNGIRQSGLIHITPGILRSPSAINECTFFLKEFTSKTNQKTWKCGLAGGLYYPTEYAYGEYCNYRQEYKSMVRLMNQLIQNNLGTPLWVLKGPKFDYEGITDVYYSTQNDKLILVEPLTSYSSLNTPFIASDLPRMALSWDNILKVNHRAAKEPQSLFITAVA